MKNSFKILFLFLMSVTVMYSCQKSDGGNLSPAFSANLNGAESLLKSKNAVVNKGITIIAGSSINKDEKSVIVITIKGAEKGEFKQEYDYVTGVSVAQAHSFMSIINCLSK